ncbi:iron complex transport system ATP-binding protein [Paenibacillus sp. SORGH_AS306]|uniref:ABC transporter ATP-binding protein n=1 Tax=unclassified Paenibacillus TaxID=185978 RepID=UPI002789C94E|nr:MULTISPECIES: ABC transporter ATP-binding protein [unclassified Paenibacillus]MDQ1235632.1 iron complex transport system ATP-binding protein [Paenibacillus sp. SORGH_AS_0306]MDR6112681.1 iron complex transport system ATP-binding protein [Paenibacillus sp. SORGH_AS_0338]
MDVNDITFSYDRRIDRLHQVNAQIQQGKITTIIGPNGCGKSTLLHVMSNNAVPRLGQVILDGKQIAQYKPKELARKLAVVHQQNEAPADLTIEKLVSFGRLPHRTLFSSSQEEDEQAIEWALDCTNLQSKRFSTLDQLSGGEQQRVWIAMALAQRTPILFLDEPTTYLDMYYQLEIMELIHDLNEQHQLTIVMVLHDINQAIRYSHHLIAMKAGSIVASGLPTDMITTDLIRDIYGVEVLVRRDLEAGLHLIPIGIGQ